MINMLLLKAAKAGTLQWLQTSLKSTDNPGLLCMSMLSPFMSLWNLGCTKNGRRSWSSPEVAPCIVGSRLTCKCKARLALGQELHVYPSLNSFSEQVEPKRWIEHNIDINTVIDGHNVNATAVCGDVNVVGIAMFLCRWCLVPHHRCWHSLGG